MPTDRWMDKEDVVYMYNRVLLSHTKKEWNNVICSYTYGTWDYHTKWSKSERERQIPYDIILYVILENNANEPIYKLEIDSQT